MKKIFKLLISLLLFLPITSSNILFAQKKNNKASLEIILSDNNNLRIHVNDRVFDEVNRKIYLKDIPAGKTYIEVYKVCNDNSDFYCNKKVFYGYIVLEKNKHYQAVVLVGEEEIVVSDKNNLFDNNINTETTLSNTEKLPTEVVMQYRNLLNGFWKNVHETIIQKETDTEKITLIRKAIHDKKSITCEEALPILATLLFDDSRIEILNDIYQYISNKQNIDLVKNAFTIESNFTQTLQKLR